MMGMEKMLASMIGMTPEQMGQLADMMKTQVVEGAETMKRIEEKLDALLAQLEGFQNDDGNGNLTDGNRNGSGERKRGTGGGDRRNAGDGSQPAAG